MKPLLVALGFALAVPAGAQQTPPLAAAKIPIRQVAPPDARTREPLRNVQALVQFADGRVLVNDVGAQRLLFFDSTLTTFTVSADTAQTGARAYPSMAFITPTLFQYAGDSAALTDLGSRAFLIIGPDGLLGHAMAHVRQSDMSVINQAGSQPAFDAKGRFVYRAKDGLSDPLDTKRRELDTVAVVRADFDARRIDTVAKVILPVYPRTEIFKDAQGKAVGELLVNPVLPAPDQWVVISDGSIAIVRPHDYHIDWVYADGTIASTPKMPFDWRRLTDADKQAKIDSAKRIIDSLNASGHPYGRGISTCAPPARGEGLETLAERCQAYRRGAGKLDTIIPTVIFPPLDKMLDYVPAIRPFAVKADRDNHVWILPSTTLNAVGGGLLYDVVNKQGEIIERVQLPPGRSIAGFGWNGVIYLLAGDRISGFTLERTRVVRDR